MRPPRSSSPPPTLSAHRLSPSHLESRMLMKDTRRQWQPICPLSAPDGFWPLRRSEGESK